MLLLTTFSSYFGTTFSDHFGIIFLVNVDIFLEARRTRAMFLAQFDYAAHDGDDPETQFE